MSIPLEKAADLSQELSQKSLKNLLILMLREFQDLMSAKLVHDSIVELVLAFQKSNALWVVWIL